MQGVGQRCLGGVGVRIVERNALEGDARLACSIANPGRVADKDDPGDALARRAFGGTQHARVFGFRQGDAARRLACLFDDEIQSYNFV